MAETAVKSTVQFLGKLLVEEAKYLYGVEGKMEELRDELLWMQCFLKSTDAIQYEDDVVSLWVSQIKENVMTAEDIIEKFVIDVMSRRRGVGWLHSLKRTLLIVLEYRHLHRVGSHIDSLRSKISMLTPRLQTYVLRKDHAIKSYTRGKDGQSRASRNQNYLELKEQSLLRLKQESKEIVKDILDKSSDHVVIVRGVDGLGKTTLAKFVYEDESIRRHFHGFAWAQLSWNFQVLDILRELVTSFTMKPGEMVARMGETELTDEIRDFLQNNKYFLVVDGVQKQQVIDLQLKAAFPSHHGFAESKVLITTTSYEVGDHTLCYRSLGMPSPLDREESWGLLKKTLGEFPPENLRADGAKMIELGKEMVEHCNGLPLAILLLGRLLIKRVTLAEWQDVHENLNLFLRSGNDSGRLHKDVLFLNYTDLPYHLKTCFLHLANFPEDEEIEVEKLYRLWAAEGLLPVDGAMSLWNAATSVMNDLAQSAVVEIAKKGSNGRIKCVRMHHLMREVCTEKAVTENFLDLIDHRLSSDAPQVMSSFSTHRKLLRMSIRLSQDVEDFLPETVALQARKYLRSLLFFGGRGVDHGKCRRWIKQICKDFRHLRILDIEGLCLEGLLTKQVRKLVHLRYLSLRNTMISELPPSIGNLRFLQILDLRVSSSLDSLKIPNTLQKLNQLTHLLLPSINHEIIESKVLRLHTLSCLEVLTNLEVSQVKFDDLLRLGRLRKLSVKDVVQEEAFFTKILQSPAIKSGTLRTFHLGVKGELLGKNPGLLSGVDCLRRLKIQEEVSYFEIPQFLKSLHLDSCKVEGDPMGAFGELDHLKHLFLGSNSLTVSKMTCESGSFRELITLDLQRLDNLQDWDVQPTSMAKLKKLVIKNCGKLKRIPGTLPSTADITCVPCVSGIEAYGSCICYKHTSFGITDFKEQFIGRTKERGDLSQILVDGDRNKVLLKGTPGIGKATLAKNICNDPDIRIHFDATACVRYPHRATSDLPRRILQLLLKDLGSEQSKENLSQKSTDYLIIELQQMMQQKRCLVVLTDLVDSDLVQLDKIFMHQAITNGSKVLVTTNAKPSSELDEFVSYDVLPLYRWEREDLLWKRLGNILNGVDGPRKAKLGKSMMDRCKGDTLSFIMLLGMLAVKGTLEEWESMEREFTGSPAEQMCALSYESLPVHLQNCFLFLANFPEDAEISTYRLCKIWAAAGILKVDYEKAYDNLEDLGDLLLNELAERGMIQVVKSGHGRRIGKCQLHLMLHSLCLAKAQEKNLVTVLNGESQPSNPPSNGNTAPIAKHVAVHLNQYAQFNFPSPSYSDEDVQTLLFFPNVVGNTEQHRVEDWGWLLVICNRFCNLRVLDLEGMWMAKGNLPSEVGNLIHLRYLSLKGTFVNKLPLSVEKLIELRTLDLRVLGFLVIPCVLQNLRRLDHIYLPENIDQNSGTVLLPDLGGLLTVANLSTRNVAMSTGMNYANKRSKFKIRHMNRKDGSGDMIESLCGDVDLSVNSEIVNEDPTILSICRDLKQVRIKGRISQSVKLGTAMFPEFLEDLTLKGSQLKDDPIPVMEKLPQLRRLCFDRHSFAGKKMKFSAGGFPKIRLLMFQGLRELEEVDMTEAPSRVRELDLVVTDCWRLQVKDR